jgi:superfamily II DNA/RNA helicase
MHIFAIYGGTGMGGQIALLRKGFDILVATPGRLLDHIERGNLRLDSTNIIVLDEADRMLDIGFKPDIDRILSMANPERQVLLFSATVDGRIKSIAREYMNEPELIEIGPVGKAVKIEETYIKLTRAEKLQKLKDILSQEPNSRTIVFVGSKRDVEFVCYNLNRNNIEAQYLHGGKSQTQRERVVRGFQEGRFRILIATDVAARGLHIDDVNHVINYDKADSEETHTHRIGRTGRMGNEGRATNFVELDPLPKKQFRGRGGFGSRRSGGYGQSRASYGQRSEGRGNYHGEERRSNERGSDSGRYQRRDRRPRRY